MLKISVWCGLINNKSTKLSWYARGLYSWAFGRRQGEILILLDHHLIIATLWDVVIRSQNYVHYNKYLSFLEYHKSVREAERAWGTPTETPFVEG
jgi:hypothetical protein